MTAAQFNARYPVGTLVRFYPEQRNAGFIATKTTSEAWDRCGQETIVSVVGFRGGWRSIVWRSTVTTLDDFLPPDACPCCFDEGGGFGDSPCPACGLSSVHAYDERDADDEREQQEIDEAP